MAYSTFSHVRVDGISAVVPAEERRIEEDLVFMGRNVKKAHRMTKIAGIDRRRVAAKGVTPSDLCYQAAECLLNDIRLEKSSIDALIFVTQHPDYILPASACILQDRLGLSKHCAAFDVNQGCAGYVYGLWLASSLVESRAATHVLLLAGDGLSRLYDKKNLVTAPIFGDCGTATVLTYSQRETRSVFVLGTDGGGAETLIVPAGGARIPLPLDQEAYAPLCETLVDEQGTPWRLNWTYMDGGAIFDFAMDIVPEHITKALQYAQKNEYDIGFLVLHQANKQIISAIAKQLNFPLEKVPMESFSKYGNTAVASIPTAICSELASKINNSTARLVLSGFGVGLSWATAVLELDHACCDNVREYVTPDKVHTPEELVSYWQKKISGDRHI